MSEAIKKDDTNIIANKPSKIACGGGGDTLPWPFRGYMYNFPHTVENPLYAPYKR